MLLMQEYSSKIIHEINNFSRNRKSYIYNEKDALCVDLDASTSISLNYNDKLKQWILTAERDITIMPQTERDQLLERLMDIASYSRYAEYLVVGITESKKVSISKNVVDVSVNQAIINSFERIMAVVMGDNKVDIVDRSSIMHC